MNATHGEARRLLVVDDEPEICEYIGAVGEHLGMQVRGLSDPSRFDDAVLEFAPHVLVMDLCMPGSDGVELLRALSECGCRAAVLLMSGMDSRVLDSVQRLGESLGLAMCGGLQKPVLSADLESALQRAAGARVPEHESTPEFTVADLAGAIDARELTVHYQPKTVLGAAGLGAIAGVEALVRWSLPDGTAVPPAVFVPVAESSGLIRALTDRVIDQAVRDLARWRAAGHALTVAVNMSARLLDDLELPDRIASAMRARDLPPDSLILELTETAAMANVERSAEVLTRFRLKGFQLSLDDFGTGYSSLMQLYRMPFNELKIDRSFVNELQDREEAEVVVRSVIDLAHALGLTVCAEGVERAEQLESLQRAGCDRAQGYLIARPMPAQALERLLQDWHPDATARSA